MSQKNRGFLAAGLILLAVLFFGNLLAQRLSIFSRDDMIVAADLDYRIDEDIDRSVALFSQTVAIDASIDGYALIGAETISIDGDIENDLTAFAETIDFNGQVSGSAVFLADHVALQGQIDGETVVLATTMDVHENFDGAIIACVEVLPETETPLLDCDQRATRALINRSGTQLASLGFVSLLNNPNAARALGVLLPLPVALFLTGFAALIVTLLPRHVANIEASVRMLPGKMVVTGSMIALMAVGVTAAFIVAAAYVPILALILCPFYLAGFLALLILVIAGWVTLALVLGGAIARRISPKAMPPVAETVLGGVVLAVAAYVVSWLPYGDTVVILLAGILELAGLGAAYATRLGWRTLVRNRLPAEPV